MPCDEKELLKRDAKRNIGEELLQAVRDIKAGRVGRVSTVEVSPLASARLKIGLSQSEFAKMLGVSLRTLQEWEQGRRTPSGAAKSLITIAIKNPEALKELLAALDLKQIPYCPFYGLPPYCAVLFVLEKSIHVCIIGIMAIPWRL